MILGIDPGLLHCGWALVEPKTARVHDLGVLVHANDSTLDVSTDRARRVARLSSSLRALMLSADYVVAESALFHGPKAAIACLCLAWGAISSVARELDKPLAEVTPKTWQHTVVPGNGTKKLDYARVERELHGFVANKRAYQEIADGRREHVLDATAIGVYAALGHPVTWVLRKATG